MPKDHSQPDPFDEYGSLNPLGTHSASETPSPTDSDSDHSKWALHHRRSASTDRVSRTSAASKRVSLRQQLEKQRKTEASLEKDKAKTAKETGREDGYTRDDPLPVRPGFLIELLLLVLLGLRTRRLQVRLLKENPEKVWTSFRDSLVKRWTQMSVTSSLLVAATGMSTAPASADDPSLFLALNLALCARAAALIAVIFGTGLALVFADASPKDLAKLAGRPIHMIFVLSAPTGFAILGMALFYFSILATTLVEGHLIARIAVIGAGGWLVFLGFYCAYLVYLVADKED